MAASPTTAFVLGAGLGTRLKALTAHLPKPLIPVRNEPLITRAFAHLHRYGVRRFVINTHWRAEAYARTFPSALWEGCPLSFSHESPEVLETAGGLKAAEHALPGDGPFWVYNGDILSDLPLERAWEAHQASGNEVTLVLRSSDGPLQVSMNPDSQRIRDLGRRLHPDVEPAFLFTGIYLVEPAFLQRIPTGTKISVIPLFLDMIRQGAGLGGVVIDAGRWWDLGTREEVLRVHRALAAEEAGPALAAGCEVAASARLNAACAVGAGAVIGPGAVLEDTVVWPGAKVEAESKLSRCIVTSGQVVRGTHDNIDFA